MTKSGSGSQVVPSGSRHHCGKVVPVPTATLVAGNREPLPHADGKPKSGSRKEACSVGFFSPATPRAQSPECISRPAEVITPDHLAAQQRGSHVFAPSSVDAACSAVSDGGDGHGPAEVITPVWELPIAARLASSPSCTACNFQPPTTSYPSRPSKPRSQLFLASAQHCRLEFWHESFGSGAQVCGIATPGDRR